MPFAFRSGVLPYSAALPLPQLVRSLGRRDTLHLRDRAHQCVNDLIELGLRQPRGQPDVAGIVEHGPRLRQLLHAHTPPPCETTAVPGAGAKFSCRAAYGHVAEEFPVPESPGVVRAQAEDLHRAALALRRRGKRLCLPRVQTLPSSRNLS